MNLRKTMLLALALMWSFSAYAQQPSQPLTFRSDYAVKAGKEEEFLNLVKAVGQPVRDKLMAEGVVLAWGVESPLLRGHDSATHTIWYVVADWSGVEKAQSGIAAQIAKLDAESGKASEEARKKGAKPAVSTMDRLRDAVEFDLTKDYATRDIVFVAGQSMPPAGTLPYTRSNFVKVKPGKADAY